MDKDVVVHIYNGILISYKWNEFESFLVNWMKLESVKQSEINQKEKKNILHQQMYVKFRKTVQTNLFAGQD